MDSKLKKISEDFGASYLFLPIPFLNLDVLAFSTRTILRTGKAFLVARRINHTYRTSKNSNEVVSSAYDIEYENATNPNYMYLNRLLNKVGFEKITGIAPEVTRNLKIIDIGAGSNELLRFCNKIFLVPKSQLYGVDVSHSSKLIIERDGFNAYRGRIENLHFLDSAFDLTFLTYFLDYDTNQKATFDDAIRITNPSGKIILEGLFPCRPLGLLQDDQTGASFVTKGETPEEDIFLICDYFLKTGSKLGKKIAVEKIVKSKRYIFNRRGLNKLPSYFLVFNVRS